jgi:hypothetical protein
MANNLSNYRAPECLVFMPMLEGYERIRAVVASAVKGSGALMSRLETALPDSEWQYWLLDAVERADLLLVDVTDHNPFVMYELGLAHHRMLPAIFIVNQANDARNDPRRKDRMRFLMCQPSVKPCRVTKSAYGTESWHLKARHLKSKPLVPDRHSLGSSHRTR